MVFSVDDEVLISAKNLKTLRLTKKYSSRYVGPFRIVVRVGKQVYRLALPLYLRKIHNVFHVSLLELYHRRADFVPLVEREVDGGDE